MYYFATWRFEAFRDDVGKIRAGKMTIESFLDAQKKRTRPLRFCEVIAWLSGLLGLAGLGCLIVSVTRGGG